MKESNCSFSSVHCECCQTSCCGCVHIGVNGKVSEPDLVSSVYALVPCLSNSLKLNRLEKTSIKWRATLVTSGECILHNVAFSGTTLLGHDYMFHSGASLLGSLHVPFWCIVIGLTTCSILVQRYWAHCMFHSGASLLGSLHVPFWCKVIRLNTFSPVATLLGSTRSILLQRCWAHCMFHSGAALLGWLHVAFCCSAIGLITCCILVQRC